MVKIMVFQGSPRREGNCPDQWGKTKLLADYIRKNAPPDVEIDYCDLSVGPDTRIGSCKGCVSTANGFHCHWPCDCYAPNAVDPANYDYLHEDKIYQRMEASDGLLFLTPINWYAASSQLKLLFDRLCCINLTITAEQARDLGINKDATKSAAVEQSGEYHHLLKNHFEGKYAAFFVHGNAGGSDYLEFAKKKGRHLPTLPKSYTNHMKKDFSGGQVDIPRNSVMPLVWQLRYSGIFVPEELIMGITITEGLNYSEAMELAVTNLDEFYQAGLELLHKLRDAIIKTKAPKL